MVFVSLYKVRFVLRFFVVVVVVVVLLVFPLMGKAE